MSEAVQPAAPAAPAQPAAAPVVEIKRGPTHPRERIAAAEAVLARKNAPPPAPAAHEPAPAAPTPAPAPNGDSEVARLRGAAQDHDRRRQEEANARKAAETSLAEARAERERERERLKKDPHSVLTELGVDIQGYLQGLAEGKFKAKSPEALAADEAKSEVQKLQERLQKLETEKQEIANREQRAARAQQLRGELDANKEHFPLLSSTSWGADRLLDLGEAQGGDYNGAAAGLEKAVLDDVKDLMLSDTALAFLLKDAEIGERLRKHLAPAEAPPTPPDPQAPRSLLSPRTLTTDVTASAAAPGQSKSKRTDSDRRRAAASVAERLFRRT
jgi:hypothetical protein